MNILLLFRPSILFEGIYHALASEFPQVHFQLHDVNKPISIDKDQTYDYIMVDYDKLENGNDYVKQWHSEGQQLILWIDQPSQKKWNSLKNINLVGYLHPKMSQEEMFSGMHHILKGRTFVTPLLCRDLLQLLMQAKNRNPETLPRLTKREWDVYKLLVDGFSNEEIADELNLSPATIKNYISSILKQIEAKDRTNAVLIALKNRWYVL
ncbi:DNA-binding response regulator, NarL/FixJ family, contains REC and HTH domains [Pelagirhabdus alkalitolerans]|uniref:DNA-binding response regulator, NarL/FixJ family, contains REC and HTH domains n=1 Tax=Pelagirhabdus alkalitolerans TaxID=1612202 RepID=A0A1G6GGY8_9BACI|nr:response regulator transcription factor [Pelagirhabdus alkalitolerans]SDB81015.1 DNA-binding response regulator, NarL/FixJ family, contains REC and HTH domains [Pelagirhabdus alkalitolerans]